MTGNNDTFMKISNKDIYCKLCDIEKHVIETNGKVKMNRVLAKLSLALAVLALSIITGINLMGVL